MYTLTIELSQVDTLMPPAVNAETDEASVQTVNICHQPIYHAEHQQRYQEHGYEGPAT